MRQLVLLLPLLALLPPAHAEDDKNKREEIELRNSADNSVYRSEKMLKDNADKVSADSKSKIEAAITERTKAIMPVHIQDDGLGAQKFAFSALFTAPELFHDLFGGTGRIEILDGYAGDGLPLGIAKQIFSRGVHEQNVGVTVGRHDGDRRCKNYFFQEGFSFFEGDFKVLETRDVPEAFHDIGHITIII